MIILIDILIQSILGVVLFFARVGDAAFVADVLLVIGLDTGQFIRDFPSTGVPQRG